MRTLPACLGVIALLALTVPARADQGAVSLDVGGGASLLKVPAPNSGTSASQVGSAPTIWIDGRYALTNAIELTATGFMETNVPFYVDGTTLNSDAGPLSGTLQMRARRYGMLAGARFLHGNVWRLIASAELGWSVSSYTSQRLLYVGGSTGPRDYGLTLADVTTTSLVLAPGAGVGWVGDKLSITILPRFQMLVGHGTSWAVTVPLTIGWDWYL